MYYTTSGAYRRSKMIIDYVNIAATCFICIIFLAIIFLRSRAGLLFAVEFCLGALVNALTGVKAFMNNRKLYGTLLLVVMLVLLILAFISWRVVTR